MEMMHHSLMPSDDYAMASDDDHDGDDNGIML